MTRWGQKARSSSWKKCLLAQIRVSSTFKWENRTAKTGRRILELLKKSMEILHPTQQLLIYVSVPQKEPSIKLQKGLTRCTKILMLAWTLIWITLWQADQEGEINRPDIHKNEPKSVLLAFNLELTKKGNCEGCLRKFYWKSNIVWHHSWLLNVCLWIIITCPSSVQRKALIKLWVLCW